MGKAQKFLSDVAMNFDSDECLIWPHQRGRLGYPLIKRNGRRVSATRIVCEMTNGRPPSSIHQAAHSCGNGHLGCINPHHLEWKTPTENQADRVHHGTTNRGERNGQARLSLDQVETIRDLRGLKTQREIAKIYGVSPSTIAMLMSGRSWANG